MRLSGSPKQRRIVLLATVLSLLNAGIAAAGTDVTYTYNTLGRLMSATYSDGTTITYTYDAAGNRTQLTTVNGGNPTAVNDSYSTNQNSAVTVDPRANDSGTGLTITAAGQGGHGTTSFTASSVTYTPTSGYVGADSFTYTITDASSHTASATVSMTVNAVAGPTAVNDSISIQAGAATTVNVLANDTSPQSYGLTVTSVTTPAHGTASVNSGGASVTYTPTTGYSGSDSFNYSISDGHGGTASATVSVGINAPPVANNDSVSTTTNNAVTFDPRTNDTDPNGDALTISSAANGTHGTVTVNSGTSLTYTPASGYAGSDSFTYVLSDGHGGTATGTVSVTVTGSNSAPTAVNDSQYIFATYNGGAAIHPHQTFDPRTNDTDPDSDTLTITGVTNGARGTVTTSGTTVTYTYTPSVISYLDDTDSYTYTISDGHGHTATATVSVTIHVETLQ